MLNKGFINGRIVSIKAIEGKNFGFIKIATTKDYRDKITGEYETQFIEFFIPSLKRLDFIKKYFDVGDGITMMYKVETREKETTENGKTFNRTEIILVVEDVELLTVTKKMSKNNRSVENQQVSNASQSVEYDADEEFAPDFDDIDEYGEVMNNSNDMMF